ncbi:MAG: helix-turn-helix transcriptional regulator [Eubacteriales bacterium]
MEENIELLIQIAKAVATQFGQDCEVVIHDVIGQELDSSVVYIENGKVSGRKIGDGCSAIVIETIEKNPTEDKLAYLTKTEDGRVLKSSTTYIRNSSGKVHYIFAINYDITRLTAMEYALHSLISTTDDSKPVTITHDVNGLLDQLLDQSVALIGVPVAMMSKDDKIKAIEFLNKAGAFLITRSGDKVSSYFGISKFTLYSYIDAGKEE